ncbi:hypothetical protein BGY98DRAFT_1192025 [Russula aff. rugulosa BPL654]|nr:hypothetical protein BGY98DRAFT_1192025 [Russula aff. rugulosa BPL654]
MSQVHPIASSSSSSFNFQSVFNAALEAYEKKTKCKLISHPLAAQLQSCDSPTAILSVLQGVIQQFDHRRSSGKDIDSNDDVLIDIFVRIEGFFMRLESYTEVPPTAAMTDVIEIRQGRSKKFVKKLLGGNDIEGALKRLDTLTMEEARLAIAETRMVVTETRVDVAETRMVTAETLNVTHKIDDKVAVLVDDVKEANAGIQRSANIADEEKQSQLRKELQNWLSLRTPRPTTI